MKNVFFTFLALAGFLLLILLLHPFAEGKLSNQKIPLKKTKLVETNILFPAGTLYLTTETKRLAEATLLSGPKALKPEISFTEEDQIGNLTIETKGEEELKEINDSNKVEWKVAINKNVNQDLHIEIKVGEGMIDLQDCKLRRFEYKVIAGSSDINLRNTSVPKISFTSLAGEATIDLSGK